MIYISLGLQYGVESCSQSPVDVYPATSSCTWKLWDIPLELKFEVDSWSWWWKQMIGKVLVDHWDWSLGRGSGAYIVVMRYSTGTKIWRGVMSYWWKQTIGKVFSGKDCGAGHSAVVPKLDLLQYKGNFYIPLQRKEIQNVAALCQTLGGHSSYDFPSFVTLTQYRNGFPNLKLNQWVSHWQTHTGAQCRLT